MIGQTISHYKITEKLVGDGGMGVVYKAEDTELDRPFALRIPRSSPPRDEEGRKRFQWEAMAAAALHDPNVGPVCNVGSAGASGLVGRENGPLECLARVGAGRGRDQDCCPPTLEGVSLRSGKP